MGRPRWKQLLLSIIWCSPICFFATSRSLYDSELINSYFAASLVTSVIIYLRLRPSVLDALWISGITTITALVDYLGLDFSFQAMGLVSLLGFAGLIVFGVRCIWGAAAERKVLVPGLLATALFTGSDCLSPTFHTITSTLHPRTLDLYLLFFDGSLGFQPSFVVGELFHRAQWLASFSMIIYITLPFSMAVAFSNQMLRNKSFGFPMMLAFVITGPIGVAFYNIFPATGPIHIFLSQFPQHAPLAKDFAQVLLAPVPVDGSVPRNAIPSLHMAWVLLAWWWSRGLAWKAKGIALVYLVFTALATVGIGEHYFVDLVVAVPFAMMLQAAVTFRARKGILNRLGPVLLGLGGVLSWFAVLRFAPHLAWSSPWVAWLMVGLTLFIYLTAEKRYCRLPQDHQTTAENFPKTLSATAD